MKTLIYLIALISLLATTGCVIRDDHRGGAHDPYEWHHGYGDEHWDH